MRRMSYHMGESSSVMPWRDIYPHTAADIAAGVVKNRMIPSRNAGSPHHDASNSTNQQQQGKCENHLFDLLDVFDVVHG